MAPEEDPRHIEAWLKLGNPPLDRLIMRSSRSTRPGGGRDGRHTLFARRHQAEREQPFVKREVLGFGAANEFRPPSSSNGNKASVSPASTRREANWPIKRRGGMRSLRARVTLECGIRVPCVRRSAWRRSKLLKFQAPDRWDRSNVSNVTGARTSARATRLRASWPQSNSVKPAIAGTTSPISLKSPSLEFL